VYQRFLDKLLTSVKGSQAALLMDQEGELVVQVGEREERHRLIGAYQGLALAQLKRVTEKCEMGGIGYVVRRHEGGNVVVRPLKDGYYLVLSMAPGAPTGPAVHFSERLLEEINEEL
jgi:predicted regulator of Ras-like GTPase activity (Roadblock/LC7/MglB family)